MQDAMVAQNVTTELAARPVSAGAELSPRVTLAGVQVLRGLAAFAVLVHHALEELSGAGMPDFVVRVGAAGVDVFFVISGFIMLHTAADRFGQPGAARDFLTRRIIRIAPLYWMVTAFIILCHVTGLAYQNRPITAGGSLSSFLFLPTDHIVLNIGWTLNFEMYFYVLFALCLALGRSAIAAAAVPVMILAGLALGHLAPDGAARSFLTDRIALEFVFGMALAALYGAGRLSARLAWPAAAAGVAGLIAASAFAPPDGTAGLARDWRFLAWGGPAVLVVYGALFAREPRSWAGRGWLALGDASYSLYISHAVVMTTFARLLKIETVAALPTALLFTGAVAVAVVVGFACYYLVERPVTRALRARWERPRRPAQA
jgi:exopolysaccharide production protein ExoZ